MPPMLPEIDETAPASISASATNCDVVGTSWCAYGVGSLLQCKKNGRSVTLSFNSITTNSPHTYHVDKTWNVNLSPLNLVAGDVLEWEFSCWATSGQYTDQRVLAYATTQVQ
ncbi:MAG: hypothetical protein AAB074_20515 [Planctomycetota bacterium]